MDLDKALSGRKAIINMQNNDNECFKWSIVCVLNPVKDWSNDWSKIPFPTPYDDNSVKKFD